MKVEINKSMKLSEHFTLGELCKTKHVTEDGNIPSRVAIENLKRICENWLEDLRYSYNRLYVWNVEGGMWNENSHAAVCAGVRPQSKVADDCTLAPDPGAAPASRKDKTSNHLSGCAVDIRCAGKEQMIRYASILLDIADGTKQDFDELLLEQHGNVCWLHFAVRPPSQGNRRKIDFLKG